MNDELFNELLESVREGGAILSGEKAPSHRFEIAALDVKHNHEGFKLSQGKDD